MDRITRKTVVGIFEKREQADQAILDVKSMGFRDDQVGVAMRDRTGSPAESLPGEQDREARTRVEEAGARERSRTDVLDEGRMAEQEPEQHPGAETALTARERDDETARETSEALSHQEASPVSGGILVGGVLGAIIALFLPGIGPIVAGGILATVLGGAAAGAVAGGLVGALAQMGVSDDEARYANEQLEAGRVVVAIKADGRADEVAEVLRRHGATNIEMQRSAEMLAVKEPPTENAPSQGISYDRDRDPASWNEVRDHYRNLWQADFAEQGGSWEEVEPRYRLGWEAARNPEYRDRTWEEVEPDLRRDWEKGRPGQPWDKVAGSVRTAWDSLINPGATGTHSGRWAEVKAGDDEQA